MTIAQRLYLLIFSAFVGLATLTVFGFAQMDKVFDAANYGNVKTVASIIGLNDIAKTALLMRVQVWQYLQQTDVEKRNALEKKSKMKISKSINLLINTRRNPFPMKKIRLCWMQTVKHLKHMVVCAIT
ncbi:hypothetical protein QN372_14620 [Undibacterium sp. RTI2.1]|uniref:hypothetical protein n=1 Tax=unclassified Undibacterium TaxID=2630295 RepID=UPI002B22FF26|nr:MULTISPECIES: hypothetical protein [unclassified Undibacterium]MEB0031991.1 hypothetical protein [Undibacterium sp. RTI2.1]MEB0118200.1 hypothetical protein [Undibacterium sp. RTI2.2]